MAILNRYDIDLPDIEVKILKIEEGPFYDLYYCSDGSRVTREMLEFKDKDND